jgi:hypothetical protein
MESPLEALLEYYRVFSTLKIGDIVEYFTESCMFVNPSGVSSTDRTGVGEALAPLIDGLRAKGYQRSEYVEPEVIPLTETAALIRGVAVRHMGDGLQRVPISYLMHRSETSWKIAAMVLPG